MENRNNVTEFVALGLTETPKMQKMRFVVLFVICTITVVGNVLIVVRISVSPSLGSPMSISPSLMPAISDPQTDLRLTS